MNPSAKKQLLERFSSAPHVPGLRTIVEKVDALSEMISSARRKAANDPHLSDAGKRAAVAKVAVDNVKPLAEATAAARKASRYNADRKQALRPPVPAKDDLVGEMQRREIRDHMKALPIGERLVFALEHPQAVLAMPAALSGLPEDQWQRVRDAFIAEKFGAEIAEIEVLDSDLELVGAAFDLAVNEARDNSGLSGASFGKLVDQHIRESDGV